MEMNSETSVFYNFSLHVNIQWQVTGNTDYRKWNYVFMQI